MGEWSEHNLKCIRRYYNVPAYLGGEIMFKGKQRGKIVGANASPHLMIEFPPMRAVHYLHPTWKVEYLDTENTEINKENGD